LLLFKNQWIKDKSLAFIRIAFEIKISNFYRRKIEYLAFVYISRVDYTRG